MTLQTVLLAGGHADREAFEQVLSQILPERVDVVWSSIFHCFKKLLGDVPGAFQSNNASRRPMRPRKPQMSQPAHGSDTETGNELADGDCDIFCPKYVSSLSAGFEL